MESDKLKEMASDRAMELWIKVYSGLVVEYRTMDSADCKKWADSSVDRFRESLNAGKFKVYYGG